MSTRAKKKKSKAKASKKRKKQPNKSRRFTPEQRQHALVLAASGMERGKIARVVGSTTETIRRWVNEAQANGTMPKPPSSADTTATDKGSNASTQPAAHSIFKPKDPGQGLAELEKEAIIALKQKHPSYQPAQVRAQLKRFKGWRISIKAIKRVFKENGFETVHRGSRPQGPEPMRFEAPRRNALWQMDFAEMRISGCKLYLLVVLDDFSRFCVGHALCDSPSSEIAVKVLLETIARHGKPEAIRTDRGGAFVANSRPEHFARVLESEMIDHIVGRAYHPQGGGKVESLIGTIRRELWDVEHFDDRVAAERQLAVFLYNYNENRAHMGIDGLTPADKFFGRADRVLAQIDALSRKRQGGLLQAQGAAVFEELCGQGTGAPVEVLRLCIVEGQMELRFCGARLPLGPIKN